MGGLGYYSCNFSASLKWFPNLSNLFFIYQTVFLKCVNYTSVGKIILQGLASPRDKSKKEKWRMPMSRSRKENEEEQVCSRISRFGFSPRSVPVTGAKMVSSKGPAPRLRSRLGLPRSPTESCGHGICQCFQPPQLSTPLWPPCPTCPHLGGTSGLTASTSGR